MVGFGIARMTGSFVRRFRCLLPFLLFVNCSQSDPNETSENNPLAHSGALELTADGEVLVDEIGGVFILTEEDFDSSVRQAEQGDAEAAMRLYEHLAAGGENYSELVDGESFWLHQAADAGLLSARQHLLSRDLAARNLTSCSDALANIERYDLRQRIENGELGISVVTIEECEEIIRQRPGTQE